MGYVLFNSTKHLANLVHIKLVFAHKLQNLESIVCQKSVVLYLLEGLDQERTTLRKEEKIPAQIKTLKFKEFFAHKRFSTGSRP